MASDYLTVNAFYHLVFIICENFNFKLLHRQELVNLLILDFRFWILGFVFFVLIRVNSWFQFSVARDSRQYESNSRNPAIQNPKPKIQNGSSTLGKNWNGELESSYEGPPAE
jgi:hypothetical protein